MFGKFVASRRRLLAVVMIILPIVSSRRALAASLEAPEVEQPNNPGDQAYIRRAFAMRQQAIEIAIRLMAR